MRTPAINKQKVYYAMYSGKTPISDADGCFTGQYSVSYGTPVEAHMNVGPAKYNALQEDFGTHDGATVQLTTANRSIAWDTNTVWWIGIATTLPHNYETLSVSKSKSACVIRLKEVTVSGL